MHISLQACSGAVFDVIFEVTSQFDKQIWGTLYRDYNVDLNRQKGSPYIILEATLL